MLEMAVGIGESLSSLPLLTLVIVYCIVSDLII